MNNYKAAIVESHCAGPSVNYILDNQILKMIILYSIEKFHRKGSTSGMLLMSQE